MKTTLSINPEKLFDQRISGFELKTSRFGLTKYVNLDNAATTPPFLCVEEAVSKYLATYGSVHRGAGQKSKISTDVYEDSREVIKDFVSAPKDSYVLFSENTTGAVNAAAYFFSFLKGKVAVSAIEHSSSWLPWVKTEGIKKIGDKQFDLNDLNAINDEIQVLGRKEVLQYETNANFEFDLDNIEKLLQNNRIKVFVLTASSNITGYCPEIEKIGKLVHKYGAYFLIDACQYLQHHKIDMQKMGIDFLVASGHKFYAPFGGGFLIGPNNFFDKFLPYQIGGGNLPYITATGEFMRYQNQLAHDPGTPNAVGAISMAAAIKQIKKLDVNDIEKYEKELSLKLFDYLSSNNKVEVYVKKKHLNTVIPFRLKNMDAATTAEKLNSIYGIGVRAGSFCTYNVIRKLLDIKDDSKIISSVKAGRTDEIPTLVRASISLCNVESDIDRMILAIKELTK
jgi:cysteine desulfurase